MSHILVCWFSSQQRMCLYKPKVVLFISTLISLSAPLLYAVFDSYHRPPSLNGCLLLRHKQLVLLQTIAKLLLTLDVETIWNDEILVQSFLCKKCDTTKVHVYVN